MGRFTDMADEIKHGGKRHLLGLYDEHLDRLIQNVGSLAEMGVTALSLQWWSRIYPGARIIGFDHSPPASCGFTIVRGDQGKISDLAKLAELGPFDIIVDDAGHEHNNQILAFNTLWAHVNHNGLYIIEDIQTSGDYHNKVIAEVRKVVPCEAYVSTVPSSWLCLAKKEG